MDEITAVLMEGEGNIIEVSAAAQTVVDIALAWLIFRAVGEYIVSGVAQLVERVAVNH